MGALAKTLLLMGVMTGLLGALGYLFLGGLPGLIFFVALAGAFNLFAYWKSDSLALRMAGAKEVTREEEPRLHRIVDEVRSLTDLPAPKVYIVDNPSPNAFATGRGMLGRGRAVRNSLRGARAKQRIGGAHRPCECPPPVSG